MGSFINIGIVHSDIDNFNDSIIPTINYLLCFSNEIIVNYPQDEACEIWEEKLFKGETGFAEAFAILDKSNVASGKLPCKFQNSEINILVNIRKEEGMFKGILFEIQEEDLLREDYSNENLNNISKRLIDEIIKLLSITGFSYAFCDSEADIEYQLCEILESEKPFYSITIIKDNFNQPRVQLSSWCIDGLTKREEH